MFKLTVDRLWVLGFTLAALVLYTANLGGAALRDWDEGTVAQVAREMARSPDWQGWLHPTLWGEPYANKPPLVHALIALGYRWGGVSEAMTRLPGAMLTALSVPLFYGMARQLFPVLGPALWSTAVYLTLLPVVRHGRLAMLDGPILCFFLLLLFCTLRTRRDPRWALGMGLSFAALCLTKSILGVLLLGMALLFLAWDTPRLGRSPWVWAGLLLGAVPVGLWYMAQGAVQGPEFLQRSLLGQSLDRVWVPVEGNRGPVWYYGWEILKSAWPWLWFWPWGWRWAWRDRHLSAGKLVLVWSVVYFAAISLMRTKLPWYVQPLYPALALAVGPVLAEAWQRGGSLGVRPFTAERYPKAWAIGQGLMGVAAIAGGVYLTRFAPVPSWVLLPALLAVLTTALGTLGLLRQNNPQFATVLVWGWYVALLALVLSPQWSWELGEDYAVKPVAALVRQVPTAVSVYIADTLERPSLNFYSDRRVIPYCADPPTSGPYYLLQPQPGANVARSQQTWQLTYRRQPEICQ